MAFQPRQVENFLGRGVTLPIALSNGRWPVESGVTLIKHSMQMILRWSVGTRFFLKEFGSRVEELLEEPNDDVLKQLAYTFIVEAIAKWETRVEINDTEIIRPNEFSVNVGVSYTIISSQKTDYFVFPFYTVINT